MMIKIIINMVDAYHYEAKLWILCGSHNRLESYLSENPQHCYFF